MTKVKLEAVEVPVRDPAMEWPDPTPVALPLGAGHEEPLHEMIKRLVREEVSRSAAEVGEETFEEANDFDMPDEEGLTSPYEFTDMQEEVLDERGRAGDDGDRAKEGAGSDGRGAPAPGAEAADGAASGPGGGKAGTGDSGSGKTAGVQGAASGT